MAENLTQYSDNYQAEINRRKSINPNDPTIAELNALRNQKIANDPSKYMQYASNPNDIYSIIAKNVQPTYNFSDNELKTKAENAINPVYDMQKLATQQKYDKLRKAAEDSRAYIDPTYDKYVDRTKESYQDTKNMVNNETLNRGMGRSSYVVDKLTDVGNKESQAINDINAERTTKMNEIDSTISMYDDQLADSIAQMDIDKATQIAAKMDELKQYYDGLKMQQDQFNLQKQAQNFNQDLATKQFNYSTEQDKIKNQQWQQQFDYSKDMDMKKFTYQQTQDKIQNSLNAGQISVSQANAALAKAKFDAENNKDSLDNQIKRAQLAELNASTAQTEAETKNIQGGLTASGGIPSGTELSESEKKRTEEVKLQTKLDSFIIIDKNGKVTTDSKKNQQEWIKTNKNNIIGTFGRDYYNSLAAEYGIY